MSSGEVSFAARLLTMTRCARGLAILVGVSAAQAERVDVVDDRRVADADGWVLELALIPIAPQDPFASCAVGGVVERVPPVRRGQPRWRSCSGQ